MNSESNQKKACGTCAYETRTANLSSTTSILNLRLSFEEALKLSIAIDECVHRLNRYNKNKEAGKRAALHLAILLDEGHQRITIQEGKLAKGKSS